MKKSNLLALGAAIILGTAICAVAQPEVIIQHRINPHSQSPNRIGEALTTGGTAATTPLIYHGGPLINTPRIYLIWYGNWNQNNGTDTPAGQQLVVDWANSIGGTPYFSINKSNSVSGSSISGNVNFGGQTTDGGKTRLRDGDIQNIVNNAINSGRLPYDSTGVYFVITSSDVSEQSGFCTRYCGWHTAATLSSGRVRYAFVGNAARCLNACAAQSISPNGNAGIDAAISVLSHELEEATTDPDLNAWYDSSGAENADKCAWTFGHFQFQTANGSWANQTFGGHNWLIQRNLFFNGTDWRCQINTTQN
jgi:Phosphate-induced protein 1 conserved region